MSIIAPRYPVYEANVSRREKDNFLMLAGRYTSLAFLLPVCIVVGYGIGYLIDRALGTHFFYIVFLLLGIAAGFVQMIRMVQQDGRRRDE
jgi:F0F1-type ATP synthase assembly protein I